MNRCAPSWNLDDNPSRDVSTLDYEVAELTWENGQITMQGLGQRRPAASKKPQSTTSTLTKCTWDKPRAGETLEAIVNQATFLPHHPNDLQVPWLSHKKPSAVAAGVDALVPADADPQLLSGATHVGSCSHGASVYENRAVALGCGAAAREWSSGSGSGSGSGTFGMESSRQVTSTASPENTSSGKHCTKSTSPDEHDSVGHSRPQDASEVEETKKGKGKSSTSTNRSRVAAIHNQSERKRRDKINQRMKALQKLIPNSNKTDKASMLDEVIEYLKQLQGQVHMMARMNMSSMMMPLAIPPQLQMPMMNPMSMGMGMGMMGMGMGMGSMDMNSIARPNIPAAGFHPPAYMHMPTWEGHVGDRNAVPGADTMSTFLACHAQSQQQSMSMEAYSRMAALFQQMQNQPCGPLPKT